MNWSVRRVGKSALCFGLAMALAATSLSAAASISPGGSAKALLEGGAKPIDVQRILQGAPELAGARVDTSGLRLGVVKVHAVDPSYTATKTLAYTKTPFTNTTPMIQTITTPSASFSDTNTFSVSSSHTVNTSLSVSAALENKVDFIVAESKLTTSIQLTVGYSYSTEQSMTSYSTTTVSVPAQNVQVPPGHSVVVEQYVEKGRFTTPLDITGKITGNVELSRCGKTVSIPVGQLFSLPRDTGTSLLPAEYRVVGDSVSISTRADWAAELALQSVITVTDLTDSSDSVVRSSPLLSGSAQGDSTPVVATDGARSAVSAGALASLLPTCVASETSSGQYLLGADEAVYQAGTGKKVPSPSGVRFSTISSHADGSWILSALTGSGDAYWTPAPDKPLSKVPMPTPAVQTSNGQYLLGADGLVYNAGTGRKVPSPTGIKFTKISSHETGSWAVSAVTAEGHAYFSFASDEPLTRVNIPTSVVQTSDALYLLGADGLVYNAGNGKRVPSPSGTRFEKISSHADGSWILSALTARGEPYFTFAPNETLTRVALPTRAVYTSSGQYLLGADGLIYNAGNGKRVPSPSGVTFAKISSHEDGSWVLSALSTTGDAYFTFAPDRMLSKTIMTY